MSTKKDIFLYNTLTKNIEPLKPINENTLGVYCCGPTVYNFQHIGNLRTYIFEDTLIRALRSAGYNVKHVMNITDVGHLVSDGDEGEDKMLVAAKREGKTSWEIAEYYTNIFFEHCSWLNIKKPDVVCKATDHIQQMIDLIKNLEEKGAAYQSGGNVYFDIEKCEQYGKLAGLDLESLKAGARIEVDTLKKNHLDFALWFTKSKFEKQEMQWDSPWGKGYPGWHIECSAMSMNYLGESLDIHCGGIDHIPVHHTNEIAQSETATGKLFSKIWMHGGFLVVGKDKMSKSTGGFLTLDLFKEKNIDPISYRLFCYSGSYRNELSWGWEAIEAADNTLRKIKNTVLSWKEEAGDKTLSTPEGSEYLQKFFSEVYNDLSMPKAIAVMHEVIKNTTLKAAEKLSILEKFDEILGLGVKDWTHEVVEISQDASDLLLQREQARKERNWALADEIRNKLTALGYAIEDSKSGAKLKKL
ncbi:MAG: cysteine--tRNA ligase [Proteobacteria bacterium]|nr:cysteine--tRNA ligase [Pseudomonadota bacterium]